MKNNQNSSTIHTTDTNTTNIDDNNKNENHDDFEIELDKPQKVHKLHETTASTSIVDSLLDKQNQFFASYTNAIPQQQQQQQHQSISNEFDDDNQLVQANSSTSTSSFSKIPLTSSQMSQLILLPEEKTTHLNPEALQQLFPIGYHDINNHQVDLRTHNSWTMKLHEIPTIELAEVFTINTIAPTILNSRLKHMMLKNKPLRLISGEKNWKFIVNVSAMEGKFYRYKSSDHPHTNMAKAAINMMTRTSAQDYVKDNIYMTAVDTGWINDEKPIEKAMKHEQKHNFQTKTTKKNPK